MYEMETIADQRDRQTPLQNQDSEVKFASDIHKDETNLVRLIRDNFYHFNDGININKDIFTLPIQFLSLI